MTNGQPVRWRSEGAVLEELERLNDLSLEAVRQYEGAAQEAAQREADHKRLRARRVLSAKAGAGDGKRVPISEAEYVADADDEVADAYMLRLGAAATADAIRERLRSIRTNQEALRTAAASNRQPVTGA